MQGEAPKKAVICAAMTMESLRKIITEMCMALIMGGNTDAFCAAKQELLTLLSWADNRANYLVTQNQEHYLFIESKTCLSQKYNYCGRFS